MNFFRLSNPLTLSKRFSNNGISRFENRCGDDVPKLEPIRSLHYTRVDKIVRDLRRIYKENPAYFDVPAFAQKVY